MNTKTHILRLPTLVFLVWVIGCAGIEQLAPPVGEPALLEAVAMGVVAEDVRNGRMIYVTNCARCHRPEAVTRYTEVQWRKTLPWMSGEAMLSPEDAAAVKAYVLVTLRAAARVADNNGGDSPHDVP